MDHLATLIEQAKVGQLALLIGTDLPRSATGRPASWDLARSLSAKTNVASSDSLATVIKLGRLARHRYVRGHLEPELAVEENPGPLHRAVVSMPVPYLMTTAYEDSLNQALKASARPTNLIIEKVDFDNPKFGRTDLIKL